MGKILIYITLALTVLNVLEMFVDDVKLWGEHRRKPKNPKKSD